jgi:hypothetical protein
MGIVGAPAANPALQPLRDSEAIPLARRQDRVNGKHRG